ncbi:MAG TPA: sel1 repeat family protein, partial [Candidatus Coprenecus avistercoris]|nr:sel1 repeat family protein [Candidatus Coprenecus avistercoris]
MKDIDYDSLSFKQLLKYAEKGDEWAQYLVGLEYAFPENEEDTDDEEAVRWFRKAADAGVPEACFRIAERMFTGSGIEQDPEAAYDLALKVAEEADLPEAWALLGFMYGAGVPVEEDMDKCRELLEKGASMGSEYAQSLLDELDNGTLFGDGEDDDDDYDEDEDEDD